MYSAGIQNEGPLRLERLIDLLAQKNDSIIGLHDRFQAITARTTAENVQCMTPNLTPSQSRPVRCDVHSTVIQLLCFHLGVRPAPTLTDLRPSHVYKQAKSLCSSNIITLQTYRTHLKPLASPHSTHLKHLH